MLSAIFFPLLVFGVRHVVATPLAARRSDRRCLVRIFANTQFRQGGNQKVAPPGKLAPMAHCCPA